MKVVLVDFAGVAVNHPFQEFGKRMAGSDHDIDQELRRLADEEMDTGKVTAKEYLEAVAGVLALSPGEVYQELIRSVKPQDSVIRLVNGLWRTPVPTAVVSNINDELLRSMLCLQGVGSFSHRFASSVVGFLKPDSRFYQHVLTEMGAKAEEAIYFDDTLGHVQVAQELGLNAYLFQGADHMEEKLTEFLRST